VRGSRKGTPKHLFDGSEPARHRLDLRPAFDEERRLAVFFGTFAPAALASDSPIAIACLRLVTVRPERPLFKVPALRSFIARSTLADAFFEYFRAMIVSPSGGKIISANGEGSAS
jgi:hypothetical protein